MRSRCLVCKNAIVGEIPFACYVCKGEIHKLCTGLDPNFVKNFDKYENCFYKCDKCLNCSDNIYETVSELVSEVRELKSLIAKCPVSSHFQCNGNSCFLNTASGPNTPVAVATVVADMNGLTKSTDNALLSNTVSDSDAPVVAAKVVADKTGLTKSTTASAPIRRKSITYAEAAATVDNAVAEIDLLLLSPAINTLNAASTSSSSMLNAPVSANAGPAVHTNNIVSAARDVPAGISANPDNDDGSNWNLVSKKVKSARKSVVGNAENNELDVRVMKKFVHISSFKPSVSEQDIISYVVKHTGILEHNIVCRKLVKRDAVSDDLKWVNFKLGVPQEFLKKLLVPDLWQAGIKVRPFEFFPKLVESQNSM